MGVQDKQLPDRLRVHLERFDSIVSWYGANRPEFRETFRAAGVAVEFLQALPPEQFTGHATDFYCAQVGAPLGSCPKLRFKPTSLRGTAVLHPFSGSARKNWPLASFFQLAAQLPHKVEWLAGPEEELPDATRFDDLADLARWLAGAALYIGNDSGITHLAAALGIPTLALFGPTDPRKWTPRGRQISVVRSQPIETLRVEAVLEAAGLLVQSIR